jgi:hypothetical protein
MQKSYSTWEKISTIAEHIRAHMLWEGELIKLGKYRLEPSPIEGKMIRCFNDSGENWAVLQFDLKSKNKGQPPFIALMVGTSDGRVRTILKDILCSEAHLSAEYPNSSTHWDEHGNLIFFRYDIDKDTFIRYEKESGFERIAEGNQELFDALPISLTGKLEVLGHKVEWNINANELAEKTLSDSQLEIVLKELRNRESLH